MSHYNDDKDLKVSGVSRRANPFLAYMEQQSEEPELHQVKKKDDNARKVAAAVAFSLAAITVIATLSILPPVGAALFVTALALLAILALMLLFLHNKQKIEAERHVQQTRIEMKELGVQTSTGHAWYAHNAHGHSYQAEASTPVSVKQEVQTVSAHDTLES